MPNYIDLFPNNYTVSHDVNNTLSINPLSFIPPSPFPLNLSTLAQDSINAFLTTFEDVTGINLISGGAQSIIDALVSFLGGSGTGNPISTLETLLGNTLSSLGSNATNFVVGIENIPYNNVLGTLGPANIGASIGSMLDGIWQGLTGGTGIGNSIGAISNAAALTAATASNAQTIGQSVSTTIVNRAVTKPSFFAVDPTGDPTFPFSHLAGASLPTITLTQGSTVIGMIGTPDAGVKQSVAWLGGGWTGVITGMYVNLYSLNVTTGGLTLLSQSANLITSASPPPSSSTPAWYYYQIPSANYLTSMQSSWYAVELEVVGTGTYTLAGLSHQAPPNLNVQPRAIGASRVTGLPALDTSVASGTGFGGGTSGSWTHNIASSVGTNGAIFLIANVDSSATFTAKVGSTSMTQLLSYLVPAGGGYMYMFVLYNPPTGAQTVSWTAGTNSFNAMVSVSWNNVTSAGTVVTSTGNGTAASQSVTAAVGQTILQGFAWTGGSGTITVYNQILLQNYGGINSQNNPTLAGYANGTGSAVSFSCTGSSSNPWAGVAVPLIGPGSSLTAPATIGAPVYGTVQPFLELCGTAGAPTYPPVQTEYTTAGTFTYTIPNQYQVAGNLFDIVLLGGGGGGFQSVFFGNGPGGLGGSWNATTLTYGTSFPLGTTTFSVTVGAGGSGGIENGALPGSGGTSSVTITGYGTITGPGGLGGGNSGTPIGTSPGNETWNGTTYYGGVADTVYGQAGSPPGGGGAGGVSASNGSPGAQGAVWILAYQ
jgi:hypothetical protein